MLSKALKGSVDSAYDYAVPECLGTDEILDLDLQNIIKPSQAHYHTTLPFSTTLVLFRHK